MRRGIYGLALDDSCAFRSDTPVHVYWRMRERGEQEIERLLDIEQPVIGLGPSGSSSGELTAGRLRWRSARSPPSAHIHGLAVG